MLKVLLIGGTGIISTDITLLASRKNNVDLYLLNRGKTPGFLPGNVKIIQADIDDAETVQSKIKGMKFDVVCDFISYGVDSLSRKIDIFTGHCGQYVFISSVAAYRDTAHIVKTESNTPVGNVLWSYGLNKTLCERKLREEFEQSGMRYTIVRPAYTYNNIRIMHPYTINHWESWTIAHRMLEGKPVVLQDDGMQLCTVTHAEDFAKGFVGLWGNPVAMNEDFHITSSEYLTWKRIAEIEAEALGVDIDFCFVPAQELYIELGREAGEKIMNTAGHSVYDSAKVRKAVPEFVCGITFSQGIRKTFEFYKKHTEYKRINGKWDAAFDRITGRFYGKNGKI